MSEERSYRKEELLRLAKRVNNPKRTYLLVNPLQGKHIPVSPGRALEMMCALGKAVKTAHGGRALVIGFAETATAIAASAAMEIGGDCVYLQTTREADETVDSWVYFSEEHSHATEQKLCGDGLDRRIRDCDYVLLVDDEISTGKTILNIVSAIRKACPAAEEKEFVVASILNRVDEKMLPVFAGQGISFIWLLRLAAEDYEEKVRPFSVREACPPPTGKQEESAPMITVLSASVIPAHRGAGIRDYVESCRAAAEEILRKTELTKEEDVLILGTEEFMFPALLLGRQLEESGVVRSVKFHATTRSPIGVGTEKDYPITNGVRLHSMYAAERVTYLYDLDRYDSVIVFSDSPETVFEAVRDLKRGLEEKQCGKLRFFYSRRHV